MECQHFIKFFTEGFAAWEFFSVYFTRCEMLEMAMIKRWKDRNMKSCIRRAGKTVIRLACFVSLNATSSRSSVDK